MSDEPKAPEDRAAAPAAPAPPLGSAEAKMRAALADSGLRDALRELDDVIEAPDPPAPDPVVVLPDKKGEVLVADTEAAAAYVQPTVRRGGPVPQDTLTRVHVDARVDPRKQPTERKLQSEVLAAAQGAAAQGPRSAEGRVDSPWAKPAMATTTMEPAALPSSRAPSSRAPSSRAPSSRPPPSGLARSASVKALSSSGRPRRGVVWVGLVVSGTLAIVVFLVLRPGPSANELTAASGAASTGSTARLGATGATAATTDPAIEATTIGSAAGTAAETTDTGMGTTTGAAASSPAGGGAAASSPRTTTTAAPWTTSSRPAPESSSDVYVDAAPPRPSAPSAVPSTGPSALPSALTTTTAGQPPPYEEP